MGDFNINLWEDEGAIVNNELKDCLLDRFPLFGLTQTVRKTTRHCQGNISTLIDHSWVSNMKKFVQTRNIETISDHDLILTTIKTKGNVNTCEKTFSRKINMLDIEQYKMDLMAQKWSEIYNYSDVDIIAEKISKILTDTLDSHVPRKIKNKKSGKIQII